jgi:hypothetical protein
VSFDNWWLNALWSVLPTVSLGLVFWFIVRAIIRADRSERRAYARIEAEERARRLQNREDSSKDPDPVSP